MRLRTYLYFLAVILGCHRSAGSNEAELYRTQMRTIVVPLYTSAYRTLHGDIIQRILRFGEESNRPSDVSSSTDLSNRTANFSNDAWPESEEKTTTAKYLNAYDEEERWLNETTDEAEIATTDTIELDENSEETTESPTPLVRLWGNTDYSSEEADEDRLLVKRSWDDSDEEVWTSTTSATEENAHSSSVMQSRLTILVKDIGAAANLVHNHLEGASSTCQQLRDGLHNQVTAGILKISAQESQLRDLQSFIERLASDISISEQQVAFYERVVHERVMAVENAEREIREAKARVERARKCQSKRRKKRFLGVSNWWRNNVERPVSQGFNAVVRPISDVVRDTVESVPHVVEEGIIKPVCSIINMDGINRATGARDSAVENRNEAQRRLSEQRAELERKSQQLRQVQRQRSVVSVEKQELETTHAAMKTNWDGAATLFDRFKIVDTYLVTILVPSKQMVVDIKRLINFDLLITPLKTLADQMVKDQIMPSFDFQISQSDVAEVDRILDRLGGKLSNLPFLIENSMAGEVDADKF